MDITNVNAGPRYYMQASKSPSGYVTNHPRVDRAFYPPTDDKMII